MANERRYWKRIGYVAIEDRNGKMVKYGGTSDGIGLDFKFSGEKFGDIYAEFQCGILGLTLDTINELTVWNPAESLKNQRHIQVFAGYEDTGIASPIFDGIILEAIPTNPPEMWLNMKCLMNFKHIDKVSKEEVLEDKTFEEIAKRVAEENGLTAKIIIDSKDYDKEKKYKFSIDGMKSSLPEKFANQFNVSAYIIDGIMYVDYKRPWYRDPKNAREVSTDYGMISLGKLTIEGINITTRLNDSYKLCSWVNLKSQIIPKANGPYFIISKKHVGHFRGEEWFTELVTFRGHNK